MARNCLPAGNPLKVGVISYGAGNIGNVVRALVRVGISPTILTQPAALADEDLALLLLPGVGAFRPAMECLSSLGWAEVLQQWTERGGPLVGICLGMQLLCEGSDEDGDTEGLGLIRGRVSRLTGIAKTPHMCWNKLHWRSPEPLSDLAHEEQSFYFVHGYALPEDSPDCRATTEVDGLAFASVVQNGSVLGFQFHPERSGPEGVSFLGAAVAMMTAAKGA